MPIEKVTGVRIPPRILEQVERFGESEGITRSQAIIKLIERGLGAGGDSATVRERLERLEKNDLELFNELNNVKNRLTNLNTAAAAQPAAPTTTPPATDRPTAAAAPPPAPIAAAATSAPTAKPAPPPPPGKGLSQKEALKAAGYKGSAENARRDLTPKGLTPQQWLEDRGWSQVKGRWHPPGG